MADIDASYKRLISSFIKFLDSNNYHETARTLEKECGFVFNLAYFEHCFVTGLLEEAEDYLAGFLPNLHDHACTVNVYFEINWHKFLDVLNQGDRVEARRILDEDLRPFERYQPDLIVSASELAGSEDFRTHDAFRDYGVPEEMRRERVDFVRANLEANPLLAGKIQYDPAPPASPLLG